MDDRHFTTEELEIAKSTDLCDIAARLGYTVRRIGKYHTVKEMDSLRIYNRKSWFRWSREYDRGERGGSQIDFLKTFAGMETKEAVFWLLDFAGYKRLEEEKKPELKHLVKENPAEEKKEFVLPAPSYDNRYLYEYLNKERAISKEDIDYFVKAGLIYEARGYHNIVFKGNDKNYGFNVFREGSSEVVVFEAAIDAMSYMDIFLDYENSLLALGMLSDAPLLKSLTEHPQIQQIKFFFDNDKPEEKAAEVLMQKYYELGYDVENKPPPKDYKDYNQWIQEAKKPLQVAWEMKPEKNWLTAESEAIRKK